MPARVGHCKHILPAVCKHKLRVVCACVHSCVRVATRDSDVIPLAEYSTVHIFISYRPDFVIYNSIYNNVCRQPLTEHQFDIKDSSDICRTTHQQYYLRPFETMTYVR